MLIIQPHIISLDMYVTGTSNMAAAMCLNIPVAAPFRAGRATLGPQSERRYLWLFHLLLLMFYPSIAFSKWAIAFSKIARMAVERPSADRLSLSLR